MKALLFTAFLVLMTSAPFAGAWKASDYAKYTYKKFAASSLGEKEIQPGKIDYGLLNAAIFYATNKQRKKHRLAVFDHSKALGKAAFGHSKDMVKHKFFSHASKVSGKKTLSKRLKKVGVNNSYAAENIANSFAIDLIAGKGFYSPSQNGGYFSYKYKGKPIKFHTYRSLAQSIVEQWMNSKGHRENILNPKFKRLGCGAYFSQASSLDEVPRFLATQNFSS